MSATSRIMKKAPMAALILLLSVLLALLLLWAYQRYQISILPNVQLWSNLQSWETQHNEVCGVYLSGTSTLFDCGGKLYLFTIQEILKYKSLVTTTGAIEQASLALGVICFLPLAFLNRRALAPVLFLFFLGAACYALAGWIETLAASRHFASVLLPYSSYVFYFDLYAIFTGHSAASGFYASQAISVLTLLMFASVAYYVWRSLGTSRVDVILELVLIISSVATAYAFGILIFDYVEWNIHVSSWSIFLYVTNSNFFYGSLASAILSAALRLRRNWVVISKGGKPY